MLEVTHGDVAPAAAPGRVRLQSDVTRGAPELGSARQVIERLDVPAGDAEVEGDHPVGVTEPGGIVTAFQQGDGLAAVRDPSRGRADAVAGTADDVVRAPHARAVARAAGRLERSLRLLQGALGLIQEAQEVCEPELVTGREHVVVHPHDGGLVLAEDDDTLKGLTGVEQRLGQTHHDVDHRAVAGERGLPLGERQRGAVGFDGGLDTGALQREPGQATQRVERPGVVARLHPVVRQPVADGVEAVRVQRLQRGGHQAMQQRPPRGQKAGVGDLAHPLVNEAELLARELEHAATDELLDGLGGLLGRQAGGALQQREAGLPPDDRGDGRQLARCRAEASQSSRDGAADGARQVDRARDRGALEPAEALDDDERITLAEPPDLFRHPRELLPEPAARDGRHERRGIAPRQRLEVKPVQPVPGQLLHRRRCRGAVQQLRLSRSAEEQEPVAGDVTAAEGQEGQAHVIRPVEILEDQ